MADDLRGGVASRHLHRQLILAVGSFFFFWLRAFVNNIISGFNEKRRSLLYYVADCLSCSLLIGAYQRFFFFFGGV